MYTEKKHGLDCLIISREEIEERIKFHHAQEKRCAEILALEPDRPDLEGQAKKAMGYKEAYESLLFFFTGKMVNITEEGEIIR